MTDFLILGQDAVERRVAAADLPYPVTVLQIGTLVFGEAAPASVWLGFADERLFAQPETGARDIRHNGAPVAAAVWLEDGDILTLGASELHISVADGIYRLSEPAPAMDQPSMEPDTSPSVDTPPTGPAMRPPPASSPRRGSAPPRSGARRLKLAVAAMLSILIIGAGLVLAVSPVRVQTDPPADTLSLNGFPPAIMFFGRYLALPGSYTVRAEKTGYRPLAQKIDVALGSSQDLVLKLRELPGYLSLRAEILPPPSITIGGKAVGVTPLDDIELDPGPHEIVATAERYKPKTRTVRIEGKGARQTVKLVLDPAWGTLILETEPAGARVSVEGRGIGETPLEAEPIEGRYRLEIAKDKWKPVTRDVFIIAGQTVRLPPIMLEKADAVLSLTSTPPGATVTVNGAYRGQTPLDVAVPADRQHKLALSKPGYKTASRTLGAGPAETKETAVSLEPEFGTVFITARPSDAALSVDGKSAGRASRRLKLNTAPHTLEISRPGYETRVVKVTPKPGVASRVNVTLRKLEAVAREKIEKKAETSTGHKLVPVWLDRPVTFQVGGSRREAGRRSNEARYRVSLSRSFLMGAREVTNAEFRAFRPGHDSGRVRGASLNAPDQPVSSVSWDDAARYANWLSAKDGLPAAYVENGKKMVAVVPMTTGYRLPTEAEWVYAARYEAGKAPPGSTLKYSWGTAMPPTGKAGNFADASARRDLPGTLANYRDGYTYAAPVAQFAPNRAGLYDMGGNVSEWCHDYYDIPTVGAGAVLKDPTGPASGRFRVVRGSSWRHGSVSQLRLAWRDFADAPRDDIGFRVVRYAD